jgi:hypothetical protein
MQNWVKSTKAKVVVLFEGRDAAGKGQFARPRPACARARCCAHTASVPICPRPGGTIKRLMEHMNPRGARVVALDKPTPTEQVRPRVGGEVTLSFARPQLAGPVVLPALRRHAAH